MPMPIYEHRITVQGTELTPAGPLLCGTEGDHLAARLVFAPLDEAYRYRVEIVTGADRYDTTDLLTAENGTLTLDVPAAWTDAGTASVRLVQVEERQDGETARCHYPPITLLFCYREEGFGGAVAAPLWQELATRTQEALVQAQIAADRVTAEAVACREVRAAVEELTGLTASLKKVVGV